MGSNEHSKGPAVSWSKKVTDILTRRKIRDLRRNIFFCEQIIDSSRSMVSVINRDYQYEKVNKTFCANHNRVPDSIVGYRLEDIWGHDNFVNNIKKNIDDCFTGRVVYYQAFFETPAWGKRYYEVVLRPVTGSGNEVTHALAETFDITELKLKEQAAIEIEWEFRNLESNLPIGFFRCDEKGKIVNVNKALVKIMEAGNESDLLGLSIRDFYIEPELFEIHLNSLKSESAATFGRVILKTRNDSEINCRISVFIVRDGLGKPIYIDGAIEDFTREADLEKRLLQSQKLDTIGLLAGGIAHDFNTILTTIYGYSELSLEGLDSNSEAYKNIKKIVQALGRARSLTNQILTFSRQVGQEKITVRVNDILQETFSFIRPSVPNNINIRTLINAPEVCVQADPTQLYRVFINLSYNAIQAMEQTGGDLSIGLDLRPDSELGSVNLEKRKDGSYAVIRFSDTGPGMEESVAARIFEPFFTTKKQGKGVGMGLSVVYGIIKELDGEILVSSKKGSGTDIEVIIPATSSDQISDDAAASRTGVLLIPENDNEVKVIAMALKNSGYNVTTCNPVDDWKAKAARADIVIIYDKSPEMPAYDLLYSLSEIGTTTPALVISDFDVWLTSEKELSSDIVKANIFKPVSLKEIISSIDTLIKKEN